MRQGSLLQHTITSFNGLQKVTLSIVESQKGSFWSNLTSDSSSSSWKQIEKK